MEEDAAPRRLIRAIAERDFEGIAATFAPDARMRMLVPRGALEDNGSQAIADRFQLWFGTYAEVELESSEVVRIAHRFRVTWRFRVIPPAGADMNAPKAIEQVVFCDVEGSTIRAIDLLCSGFIAEASTAGAGMHSFDARDLGCADGLAEQFRGQIGAIPVGDVLEVIVADPASKSDLPALARMLGHTVLSAERRPGERLAIAVERRK